MAETLLCFPLQPLPPTEVIVTLTKVTINVKDALTVKKSALTGLDRRFPGSDDDTPRDERCKSGPVQGFLSQLERIPLQCPLRKFGKS